MLSIIAASLILFSAIKPILLSSIGLIVLINSSFPLLKVALILHHLTLFPVGKAVFTNKFLALITEYNFQNNKIRLANETSCSKFEKWENRSN